MTIREIYIYYYERIENILLFYLILDSSYLAGVLFYAGVAKQEVRCGLKNRWGNSCGFDSRLRHQILIPCLKNGNGWNTYV